MLTETKPKSHGKRAAQESAVHEEGQRVVKMMPDKGKARKIDWTATESANSSADNCSVSIVKYSPADACKREPARVGAQEYLH